MQKNKYPTVETVTPYPEVMAPGFVTFRFSNGDTVALVVDESSLSALRQLFMWQLWSATAPPLTMVEVADSLGNRWYWQPHPSNWQSPPPKEA